MNVDLGHIWSRTLSILEEELPKPSYHAWLKNTSPVALYENRLVVGVPNEFAREWLETRYAPLLAAALQRITDRRFSLEFVVSASGSTEPSAPDAVVDEVDASFDDLDAPPTCCLNPKYTFDTFVIGNGNRFAHAAALAVSEAPARAYNPLFIYGGVGLGKTHLMQAVGHDVLGRIPALSVVYVSSESFTNELINAIRDHRTTDFRDRYRSVDVLLIDDIQFLAGKESTQEEFFHTFNALHAANKQIVISSDRPPKEIPTLEERLRSRFEGGLISDIQPPDLETRIAILRKKGSMEDIHLPDDVIHFIATRIDSNIRELEGAFIRLLAFSSLADQPITVDMAAHALRDILPPAHKNHLTISRIQEACAAYYDLPVDALKERRRTKVVAQCRQVAMYLARSMTDSSLPKIGQEFGGRDHTTVLHACEKISQQIKNDRSLRAIVEGIEATLRDD